MSAIRHEPAADDRRDLVLLHGYALHSGLWGDWHLPLAAQARVTMVDLPGHGLRPWVDGIADLAGLARSLSGRVPDGAVVLGWSLGGMVALELARQRPAALGGLVLLASTPRFLEAPDWPQGIAAGLLETFARDVAADYPRALRDFLALQVYGADDPRSTLRTLRTAIRSRPAPDPRALAAGLDILRVTDLRGSLHGIELPALVIAGQHDRLTHPRSGAALAAALPRSEYRLLEGAGHAPFLSHAALV